MERVRIATKCPACGSSTLVIGSGDWLVCSLIGCPDPTLINHFERAHPPTRTWTSAPTEPGWYWFKYTGSKYFAPVHIQPYGDNAVLCFLTQHGQWERVDECDGEWCPLDSPPQE